MKTKRSKNKLVVMLNKQTIANLNHWEMVKIGAGYARDDEQQYLETEDPAQCPQPTPVPTDGGITPQILSDILNC